MFTTSGFVLIGIVCFLLGALLVWGFRSNRRNRDENMYWKGYEASRERYQQAMTVMEDSWRAKLIVAEQTIKTLRQQSDQLSTALANQTSASTQ